MQCLSSDKEFKNIFFRNINFSVDDTSYGEISELNFKSVTVDISFQNVFEIVHFPIKFFRQIIPEKIVTLALKFKTQPVGM